MNRVTMRIDGMSCGHCVTSVRRALQAIDGAEVEEVKVGAAIVRYDPSATSAERLEQAVEEQGYQVVAAS